MLSRTVNVTGQKDLHFKTYEDRSINYRNWIRTQSLDGFFSDCDLIKWKRCGDDLKPCAITELTKCDDLTVGEGYLKAIIDRYFGRELQGRVLVKLSQILEVPAYIVLFQKDFLWLWVYSIRRKVWRKFTVEEWGDYLKEL